MSFQIMSSLIPPRFSTWSCYVWIDAFVWWRSGQVKWHYLIPLLFVVCPPQECGPTVIIKVTPPPSGQMINWVLAHLSATMFPIKSACLCSIATLMLDIIPAGWPSPTAAPGGGVGSIAITNDNIQHNRGLIYSVLVICSIHILGGSPQNQHWIHSRY